MTPSNISTHAQVGDAHFRQITESARHFAVITLDILGHVIYWNAGAAAILGWSAHEMHNQSLNGIYTDEDVAAGVLQQEMNSAIVNGYGSDERWHLRRNGERFWASGELTPLKDDSGKVYGFAKILQDRTRERQSELHFQASAVQLETTLVAKTRECDRLWSSSLDLLLEIDARGYLRAVNPAWKPTLGYDRSDLVDEHFGAFVHPDDVVATANAIREASSGPLVRFDVRIRHKDGEYRDIAWTAAPGEGLIYANGRDITAELRQAKLLAERSQARLRAALEMGQMGVWEWDFPTNRVQLLEGALALHGITEGGSAVFDNISDYFGLIHAQDRDRIEQEARHASEQGGEHRFEYRIVHPDGGIRWLEVRGTVLRNEHGRPCAMQGVSVDITKRKHDELDTLFLAQASAELAALVEPQSTFNKIATLAVPNFADWCAIDLVEKGRLIRVAVAHVDPEKVALAHELHKRYPPKLSDPNGTWEIVRTGRPAFVPRITDDIIKASVPEPERRQILADLGLTSYIGVPLVAHGEVIAVGTFITAESGRIYTEQDLRLAVELAQRAAIAIDNARLYESLRQADQDKDIFLATLAHELRNPLAALANGTALIKLQANRQEQVAIIQQMMQRQISQLTRLVDDLLDISRIATGKIVLKQEPTNLSMVINHAVEVSRPAIEAGHHQFALCYPNHPIEVLGDAARLTQVFANLLGNAAKFTPSGGRITLNVTCTERECVVSIKDTGMGIEAAMLPQIFRLFAQGRQLATSAQSGLGIGLSLVDRLVQMHGGQVTAHSAGPGQGSEFIVQLPISATKTSLDGATNDAESALKSTWWNKRSVLVVDDNIDAAETLSELLRAFGANVRTVNSGASAIRAAGEDVPAVVLLDIGMPEMDGHEVARRLRAEHNSRQLILIALTGWGQEHDKDAALAAGFDHHWVKPVTIEQLTGFTGESNRT